MRKKQVLALLLSGALTFSMAPAAVFAEDASELSIEDVSDAGIAAASETPEEEPAEAPAETPAEAPAEEPTEAPTETPTETPVETPTEAPAETPTEVPTTAPGEVPVVEIPSAAEGNLKEGEGATPTPTEAATKPFTVGDKSFDTLDEALAACTTPVANDEPDTIILNQDLVLDKTVELTGKNIVFATPADKTITISRKSGFKGNMFEVKDSFVYFCGTEDYDEDGNDIHGTLTINGASEEMSEGSIVSILEGGSFQLMANCTLTGNKTSANGAAIHCTQGIVLLSGGTITGNSTTGEGGAIFSDSTVYAEGTVTVTGNTGAEGAVSNIVLANDSSITDPNDEKAVVVSIIDKLEKSTISIQMKNPAAGVPVVCMDSDIEGITLADVLPQFTYEGSGDFSIDETGFLKSQETPEETKLSAEIKDAAWLSTNKVKLTVTSNKDATVYIKVVKTGTKAPTADEIKKDNHKTTVSANKSSAITYTFSTSEKTAVGTDGASIYLCFIDNTGEAVVVSKDMDPAARPPKLTGVDASWTGHDSATVIFQSDKSGTYYWTYGTDSTAPAIEKCTKGAALAANANTPIYVEGITTEGTIYVYIYVKSDSGLVSAPLVAELQSKSRPAAPTQTPTRDPKVPAVTESTVTGLEKPLEFYPNTFYPFTVSGAGMDNTDPIEGDVRWNPLYWSTSSNPSDSEKHSTWKIGAAGGIKKAATYNLYIFYRQEKYTGNEWRATDNISSVAYQFQSAAIEFDDIQITPGANGTYSYYDEDGNLVTRDADGNLISRTDDTTDTGSVTATGANTADESPVGTMSMLAVLSLLAGGYVLVRKRKRITE